MAEEKKEPAQGSDIGKTPPGQTTKHGHAGVAGASENEKRQSQDEAQKTSKGLCLAAKCTEKIHKYRFCTKHFEAFELGLMTKHGHPAKDYDQKLRDLMKKKKIKAA